MAKRSDLHRANKSSKSCMGVAEGMLVNIKISARNLPFMDLQQLLNEGLQQPGFKAWDSSHKHSPFYVTV